MKVANREGVDYRDFLRRFAVPREVIGVDGDAFDYGFYSYGLRLYGNMPLVEPPETREEKRIQDFVIAVDTSMSTSGDLVRQFLSVTYAILRSTETFSTKVNIRILQCDDQLRSDTAIHDLRELETYMNHFALTGGSATDFRPVFTHVEQLRAAGAAGTAGADLLHRRHGNLSPKAAVLRDGVCHAGGTLHLRGRAALGHQADPDRAGAGTGCPTGALGGRRTGFVRAADFVTSDGGRP